MQLHIIWRRDFILIFLEKLNFVLKVIMLFLKTCYMNMENLYLDTNIYTLYCQNLPVTFNFRSFVEYLEKYCLFWRTDFEIRKYKLGLLLLIIRFCSCHSFRWKFSPEGNYGTNNKLNTKIILAITL